MSADIVGSTAYKQSLIHPDVEVENRIKWVTKTQGFYFEAARAFINGCKAKCPSKKEQAIFGELPKLWKTIGDEVVFVKVITDHRQVAITLHCWLAALNEIRSYLNKDGSPLDVKSTAWLAGFPFSNSEVAVSIDGQLPSDENGDWFVESGKVLDAIHCGRGRPSDFIDFIGPSIDVGFRLSSLSTKRKMMIGLDIAYVISLSTPGVLSSSPVFKVYYDGPVNLKGVLGGAEYPAFWLDLSLEESIHRFEDKLTKRSYLNRDDLSNYCAMFYDTYDDYLFRPFIDNPAEQVLNVRPSWYAEKHSALIRAGTREPLQEPRPGSEGVPISPEMARRLAELSESWKKAAALSRLTIPIITSEKKPNVPRKASGTRKRQGSDKQAKRTGRRKPDEKR